MASMFLMFTRMRVDRLGCGVALGFAPRFGQLQHRGGYQPVPPRSGFEHVGCTGERRSAFFPVEPAPPVGGFGRGFYCRTDVFGRRAMHLPQLDGVLVREHDRHRAPGSDLPALDDVGDLVASPADFSQRGGTRRRRWRAGERAVNRQGHGGSESWVGSASDRP
jgi:hypothetical protein